MEKEYETKKQRVLEIVAFFEKNKKRPGQNAKDKYERSLSASLTKYQTFYRTGNKGTSLPDDLLKILVDKKLITTKEEEEEALYNQKKEDVLAILSWAKKHHRKPTQSVNDDEERILALRLNNYQKYYRNPKNGTKLPADLMQLLIDGELITKEDEAQKNDYEKKKQEVEEVINWIKKHNRKPSTIASDKEEKKLAIRLSNYQQRLRNNGKGVKLPEDLLQLLIDENLISYNDKPKTFKTSKLRVYFLIDGQKETFKSLADKYQIDIKTIRENYHKYGSITRAIDMIKYRKNKRNNKRSYDQLKKELNLSDSDIEKIRRIEQTKVQTGYKKGAILTYQDMTLYKYCLIHGLNYTVIRNKVKKEEMKPEDAINQYLSNGNIKPNWWIYEKSSKQLKYLMLQYQLLSEEIVSSIKDKNMTLEEAIEYHCLKRHGSSHHLNYLDINYLYDIAHNFKDKEYFLSEAKEAFALSDKEWKILLEGIKQANIINRDLKLFDLSLLVNNWSSEEILDYLRIEKEENDQSLKRVFFEQGTIFDEKNYDNRKSQEMKRTVAAIGENWILLAYENQELNPNELAIKKYIEDIINRYDIPDDKVKYYCDLSKKYEETKKLMESRQESR